MGRDNAELTLDRGQGTWSLVESLSVLLRFWLASIVLIVIVLEEKRKTMLHKIVIALMIWGLILQPLRAAVPDLMPVDGSSTAVVVDSDNTLAAAHHAMSDNSASVSPCHDMVDEVSDSSLDCADCDDGCATGACASSCSVSSPAIANQALTKIVGRAPARVAATSDALLQGLLTRIFHPPKHA